MNYKKTGSFIKERRIEKGMTQEQLADKLNVSKSEVSRWERGLNLPGYETLEELARLLNTSEGEIINGEKSYCSVTDTDTPTENH